MLVFRPIILVLMSIRDGLETLSDESLMLRYADGEELAFSQLYQRYKNRIHGYIRLRVSDQQVASELTHDTFLRVIKAQSRYTNSAKFSTWIIQIAKNLRTDYLRKKRPGKTLESRSSTTPEDLKLDTPPPDEVLIEKNQRACLARAVQKLPENQRDVFKLRFEAQLSFREISELLEVSENTVKSRMRYALEAVSRDVKRQEGR